MTIEEVRRALEEDGYYCVDDPTVGTRIQEMEEGRFQFISSTREGWKFCDNNILNNKLVLNTFEPSYKVCRLGYYRRIAADPGHVFQFRKGSQGPDILLVQLWGKGHKAIYFPGSHRIASTSIRAANRLWEVVRAELTQAGIKGRERSFEEGGVVILDARLSLEMPTGDPVTAGFVGADDPNLVAAELARWRPLEPPISEAERSELDKRVIGVHYVVRDANKEKEESS